MLMVDEIWGFIGATRKNAAAAAVYGDVWTLIALDADTKLIPSFISGKRDAYHAKTFIADLASRLQKRVQVSSDSLAAYADAWSADLEQKWITARFQKPLHSRICIRTPLAVIALRKLCRLKRTMGSTLTSHKPTQPLAEATFKVLAYTLRR